MVPDHDISSSILYHMCMWQHTYHGFRRNGHKKRCLAVQTAAMGTTFKAAKRFVFRLVERTGGLQEWENSRQRVRTRLLYSGYEVVPLTADRKTMWEEHRFASFEDDH